MRKSLPTIQVFVRKTFPLKSMLLLIELKNTFQIKHKTNQLIINLEKEMHFNIITAQVFQIIINN